MTLTPQLLLTNGYMKFHDPSAAARMTDWYQASYQKRVRDDKGTRYFITISHSVMPAGWSGRDNAEQHFFTPSNQFNKGDITFNIDMIYHNHTLDEVEQFFHDLWEKMELDRYDD